MLPDVTFDLNLEHGRCIGIRIPPADDIGALAEACLVPAERQYMERFGPVRRRSWVAGRAALREVLRLQGFDVPAILADARGAPALPDGLAGSISHKEDVAVALLAPGYGVRVGVDIENDAPRTLDIARRVLTAGEQREVAALDPVSRGHEVLLRFSTKEAVYKALDPYVKRYIGFTEVSVTPQPDGGAEVRTYLPPTDGGPFAVEVRWRRFDGVVLTTARAAYKRP